MQDEQKEQLKRFLKDQPMSKAVYSLLRSQFLKQPKERDVQFLAASWLAKDLFEEAWKELLKHKGEPEREEKPTGNIGV